MNDLGWVSYRTGPHVYVLDLYGLASNEALQRKVKDASWMDDVVRRRGIRLAMIYPWWFEAIPNHWLPIAHLHLSGRRVAPADDKVTFYATDPNAAEELREKLDRFAPTLPQGVRLTFPCPAFGDRKQVTCTPLIDSWSRGSGKEMAAGLLDPSLDLVVVSALQSDTASWVVAPSIALRDAGPAYGWMHLAAQDGSDARCQGQGSGYVPDSRGAQIGRGPGAPP